MKSLKKVPEGNKGLPKLPKAVRNKMGYMKNGGVSASAKGKKKSYHKGCGAVMSGRRKQTKYSQEKIMKQKMRMRKGGMKMRGGGMYMENGGSVAAGNATRRAENAAAAQGKKKKKGKKRK